MDALQDDSLVKDDLKEHDRLKSERAPWEGLWREVDELFPHQAGGFTGQSPGNRRGDRLYDTTHLQGHSRFVAAMTDITTPEHVQYIRPRFVIEELNKERAVKIWREEAGRRMHAMRYVSPSGFGVATDEDWDQLGRYGTSPFLTEANDWGMIFRALPLSECFIDVDWSGMVDRVHRCFQKSARQCEGMFGKDNLTPKMLKELQQGGNPDTKFEILHVVAPNALWDGDRFDHRRFPISSRYIAVDEKMILRRKGYRSMPISVSRLSTSPGDAYGRSIAMRQMGSTQGLQTMRYDTLRAAGKLVDPPLAFFDDDGLTSLATKKGGLNPGLMNEEGRILVGRIPGGENGIPYAMEMIEQERDVVRKDWLEEVFKIIYDPNSRMTTVEVMELIAKQGVLVRPYANRYRDQTMTPVSQLQLELAMAEGQIDPLPEVVREARAYPVIHYENPLAMMARAESTSKTLRFVEATTAIVSLAESPAADALDIDAMIQGTADEIGVNPLYVRDLAMIQKIRGERQEAEAAAASVEQLQGGASAFLDIAKGNQIAEGM